MVSMFDWLLWNEIFFVCFNNRNFLLVGKLCFILLLKCLIIVPKCLILLPKCLILLPNCLILFISTILNIDSIIVEGMANDDSIHILQCFSLQTTIDPICNSIIERYTFFWFQLAWTIIDYLWNCNKLWNANISGKPFNV
jgi:hypothetical protein